MLAVLVVALVVAVVTGSVNLQMPLYVRYASSAGAGETIKATMFAAYVAGLLPTLIFFGGLSDRIGRRFVLLIGMFSACAATACVTLWPGLPALFPARVLQGIGVGLTVGTATAYLTELMPNRPGDTSRIVALTTSLGFGGGALVTTGALALHDSSRPVSYFAMLLLGALGALGLAACPPLTPRGGRLLRLPHVSHAMMLPGLSIAMAWSVSGLVVAIIPSVLAAHQLGMWAGPVLFLVNAAGILVQGFAKKLDSTTAMRVGYLVIPAGFWLMVVGARTDQLAIVLVGACLCGTGCYGFVYLGGLSTTLARCRGHESRASAGYFLFAYIGFGLPSILVGYLADRVGASQALTLYGLALIAVCAGLFAMVRVSGGPTPSTARAG